jgi:hypothetical protein
MVGGQTREQILGTLAGREAASMADPDIAERHGVEKRKARLRIMAKMAEFWGEYRNLPFLQTPGLILNDKLTDRGGRRVREKVVELLRSAPLTHGFPPNVVFANSHDIGERLKNCWHLNMGSGNRERTETHLFRYDAANATPQMQTYSAGGQRSATFQPNTRPFYAALNYSRATWGGSSRYGKTHFILKNHMRFNATFLSEDSFGVESNYKADSVKHLSNYHNVYPLILDVRAGRKDSQNADICDILKSIIDHALGLKQPPNEEFTGSEYIEAQIPGDILIGRDIEKVVVYTPDVPRGSKVGKNIDKFAAKHCLLIKYV